MLLILLLAGMTASYADSESDGAAAEQAGRYREALNHYVEALQAVSDDSDKDRQLREKIIVLAQKLTPPPAVPEEAQKFLGRGQAAVEIAKTSDDFLAAIAEFKKAVRLAPWLASAYFNLALVQEKAGQFNEAMRNFKLYLLAAPAAADAQDVKTRIYGLELKAERQMEEEREKAASIESEQKKQEVLNRFKLLVEGNTYELRLCSWFNIWEESEGKQIRCNEAEYGGSNWYKFSGPGATYTYYQFEFTSDGKILFCGIADELFPRFTACPSGYGPPELIGAVEGSDFHSIRWTNSAAMPEGKPFWVRYAEDWSSFTISYDRPADDIGYNPASRYVYNEYRLRK
jgi:tetratricopeptide (TPR) repeat protein